MRHIHSPIHTSSLLNHAFDLLLDHSSSKDISFTGNRLLNKVDIFADDSNYVLEADLPGIEQSRVHIEIEGKRLTLKIDKVDSSESQSRYLVRERTNKLGNASRSFLFDDVLDADTAHATMEKGVLKVTVAKKANTEKRVITLSE